MGLLLLLKLLVLHGTHVESGHIKMKKQTLQRLGAAIQAPHFRQVLAQNRPISSQFSAGYGVQFAIHDTKSLQPF